MLSPCVPYHSIDYNYKFRFQIWITIREPEVQTLSLLILQSSQQSVSTGCLHLFQILRSLLRVRSSSVIYGSWSSGYLTVLITTREVLTPPQRKGLRQWFPKVWPSTIITIHIQFLERMRVGEVCVWCVVFKSFWKHSLLCSLVCEKLHFPSF